MNELSNEKIDAVIQELRTKSMDPKRWVDVYTVAIETIIDLREQLDKLNGCLIAEQEHNEMLQTKPLSDEEIWELHQEHIDEIPCGHSMKTIGFVEFARAIEERHGIK